MFVLLFMLLKINDIKMFCDKSDKRKQIIEFYCRKQLSSPSSSVLSFYRLGTWCPKISPCLTYCGSLAELRLWVRFPDWSHCSVLLHIFKPCMIILESYFHKTGPKHNYWVSKDCFQFESLKLTLSYFTLIPL